MTKGRLMELLKEVPDNTIINVLNRDGEYTSNINFWFEDLETRKFVTLDGNKPFWKISLEKKLTESK